MAYLQGSLIEEQNRYLEDLTKKLTDYNHRFNDLTDVLKLHFASGNVHDKLVALIEGDTEYTDDTPSTSCGHVPSTSGDHVPSTISGPDSSCNRGTGSASGTPGRFTKVLSKKRVILDENDKKPAILRAQHLKEQIDLMRDECKL